MRLTLRTMLAYLDGILEPSDAQDIGKKVEDSEFASTLMHRIRDVMRRLRLGAPSLTDRGPHLDPNTVAEYLDNTLPSEQVTDFEKVCLDSDVHLAEVASCHQILTLVLGEPAEIEPASRQRMYLLKDAPAEVHSAGAAAVEPAPPAAGHSTPPPLRVAEAVESDVRKPRPKPTVPQYLREEPKKRRWVPITALLVAVVCFTLAVLKAFGQLENHTPMGDFLARLGLVSAPTEVAGGPGATTAEKAAGPRGISAAKPAAEEPAGKPAAEQGGAAPKQNAGESPDGTAKAPSTEPILPLPPETAKAPAAGPPSKLPEPPLETATEPTLPPPPDGEKAKPDGGTAKMPPPKPPEESALLPPEPLGRLMSSDQALLSYDRGAGWTRVGANQMLVPGRLLTLPTYRARVTLTLGVTLDLLGGTQVELLGSGSEELPGLRVIYGRVVMMPLVRAGSRLRIKFGDRSGELAFTDADSQAALEVRRVRVPGTKPEGDSDHITAELYAITGRILWDEMPAEKRRGRCN